MAVRTEICLRTEFGNVWLAELPIKHRGVFIAPRVTKDGNFDMRTKSGKAAARKWKVVRRWKQARWVTGLD